MGHKEPEVLEPAPPLLTCGLGDLGALPGPSRIPKTEVQEWGGGS